MAVGADNDTGLTSRNAPACRTMPSAERRAPSAERRAPSAERRAPSAERRAPSAERRAPSAERRAPSAERRAPSAERRAPSAERRAPSAERRAPSAEAMTAPRARSSPTPPRCRRRRRVRAGARGRGVPRAARYSRPARRGPEQSAGQQSYLNGPGRRRGPRGIRIGLGVPGVHYGKQPQRLQSEYILDATAVWKLAHAERSHGLDLVRRFGRTGYAASGIDQSPHGARHDGTGVGPLPRTEQHHSQRRHDVPRRCSKWRGERRDAHRDGGQKRRGDTGLDDWSIADGRRARARDIETAAWSTENSSGLRIRLLGNVLASADATLSGLALADGTTAVKLNRRFASDRTDYTASVANNVSSVTVTATKNDDGATIAITGDTDTSTPGTATLDLSVGENPITVTVTAANGTSTETYTATVTRAVTPPADAVWSGTVTVGAVGIQHGFSAPGSVGSLPDSGFMLGSNNYTIDTVLVGLSVLTLFSNSAWTALLPTMIARRWSCMSRPARERPVDPQ